MLAGSLLAANAEPWSEELTAARIAYENGDASTAVRQWQLVISTAKENKIEGPQLAAALNRLGEHYLSENKLAVAEQLVKRSLSLLENTVGDTHPDLAPVLDNYANLMRKTNRPKMADRLELRAKAIWLQCAPASDFDLKPVK